MDLDLEDLGSGDAASKAKWVGAALVFVVAVLAIAWLAIAVVAPRTLAVSFSQPKIAPGMATSVVVEIKNTGMADAKDVNILVSSENPAVVTVVKSQHTEAVIGKGAYRKLEFPVAVSPTATPGTYKITVTAFILGKQETADAYLEVSRA
jgi:hypothetical protein